jgi:hypothetical protein
MTEIRVGLILKPPEFSEFGLFTNNMLISSKEQTSTIQSSHTIKKRKTMNKRLKNELSSYLKHVERKVFSDSEILTKEEIAVIYGYSEDRSEGLNEQLQRDLGEIKTEFGKELNAILGKIPNFGGLVFKGASINKSKLAIYENASENSTPVIEHTFYSTSKSELIAKAFMKNSRTDVRVLFVIYSKFGKDIEKYSKWDSSSGQNEKEVLFRPNSSFQVLNIDKDETKDFITITLNEIREYGTT